MRLIQLQNLEQHCFCFHQELELALDQCDKQGINNVLFSPARLNPPFTKGLLHRACGQSVASPGTSFRYHITKRSVPTQITKKRTALRLVLPTANYSRATRAMTSGDPEFAISPQLLAEVPSPRTKLRN